MIVTLKPINIGALADWDTGNVTDMSSMFDGCSSLTDLNALINGDTSAVNNMKAMFNGISQLTDTSALNDWDILNTSNFTNMFLSAFEDSISIASVSVSAGTSAASSSA